MFNLAAGIFLELCSSLGNDQFCDCSLIDFKCVLMLLLILRSDEYLAMLHGRHDSLGVSRGCSICIEKIVRFVFVSSKYIPFRLHIVTVCVGVIQIVTVAYSYIYRMCALDRYRCIFISLPFECSNVSHSCLHIVTACVF